MATALPTAIHTWDAHTGRGFWTKRKKTASSMLAVLALIAGIAIAFKLFDQTVPNNVVRDASNFDFAVEVFRGVGENPPEWMTAGADAGEVPIFDGSDSLFPGESLTQDVRIRNTNTNPAKDASFFAYVDPASITVRQCTVDPANPDQCTAGSDTVVDPASTNWTKFVNLWTLSVDKEKVLTAVGQDVNENDHGLLAPPPDPSDHDASAVGNSEEVCKGGLKAINRLAPCSLGMARAAGSAELGQDGTLQPTDTRWYAFTMEETDDGTDQSIFKGWSVTFTLVFQARVPAIQPSGAVAER